MSGQRTAKDTDRVVCLSKTMQARTHTLLTAWKYWLLKTLKPGVSHVLGLESPHPSPSQGFNQNTGNRPGAQSHSQPAKISVLTKHAAGPLTSESHCQHFLGPWKPASSRAEPPQSRDITRDCWENQECVSAVPSLQLAARLRANHTVFTNPLYQPYPLRTKDHGPPHLKQGHGPYKRPMTPPNVLSIWGN